MLNTAPEEKVQKLLKDADRCFDNTERKNAECTWQKLAEYVVPSQNAQFQGDQTKGDRKDQRIFDITGITSCRDFSAALHSIITNPATRWAKVRFQDAKLNDMDSANEWLSTAGDCIYNALNNSNFDLQIGIGYKSLGGFGSMILLHDEINSNGLYRSMNFMAWHLSEVAIKENHLGEVDRIYRKFKLTGTQTIEKFGKDNLDPEIVRAIEMKPDDEYDFVHAIYPRDMDSVSYSETVADKRPIASCYIMKKGNKIVREDGYYELPVYVVRWDKLPGEVYGQGPGHTALNDILTLNSMRREVLKGIGRAVNPTFLAEDGNMVIGDFRPGRLATVKNIAGFKEVVTNSRFDVTFMEEERLQNSIKSAFYIDKLMLPPRTETGEMTAYEIQERLAQNQIVLGPPMSRLNVECLTPLIMRTIKILMRAGIIPPIPDDVISAAKGNAYNGMKSIELEIAFVNSLAQSQQMSELRNLNAWVQETAAISQVKPEALDSLNIDEIVEKSARIRDIPEQCVNTSDEIDKIRSDRADQQKQMQGLAAAESVGSAAKDMSTAQKNMNGGGL